MPDQAQGATQTAEPVTGQQPAAQQTQTQEGAQQTAATTTQQTVAQPTVEELQTQLQQEREARTRYEQSTRHFQSLADQNAARLRAMAGVVPQEDPIAKRAKFLTDGGLDESQSRLLATFVAQELTPLQQENQQLRAAQQATGLVNQAYQQAAAAHPELFADPKVAQYAYDALQAAAQQGQGNLVHPEYARQLAVLEWSAQNEPWKRQQTAPAQAQQQRPFAPQFGFNGPQGGYQALPVQQNTKPAMEPATNNWFRQMAGLPAQP